MQTEEQKTQAKTSSFVVFWLEEGEPNFESFLGNDIGPAMKLCEALRKRARAGEPICHVCLSSDLVDNVTMPGVSDVLPEGYDWTKRRGGKRPRNQS